MQKKSKCKKSLLLWIVMIASMILLSGCSFSLDPCSDEKLSQYAVTYIKGQGYSTVAQLDSFEVLSNEVFQNKKEQVVQFACSFLDDTIRYDQFYEVSLKYNKKWEVQNWSEIRKEEWKDRPIAGVSMAQALDDIDGYPYESKFSNGILDITKTNSACVQEQWEDLDKLKSGIRIGFSLVSGGALEEFTVLGEYNYVSGKGWRLVEQDIQIVPKIVEPISDDILLNAVSMLQIEYEGESYMFSDMKKIYYDVKETRLDSAACEASVEMYVHGETELLYIEFTTVCDFRYSDGWYFYKVDSYDTNVKVGYLNDICLVSEKLLKEELSNRDFKYGFAKDIPMQELEIQDFEIVSHRISEKGYRQEVSYTYALEFDCAKIHIRGNAVYIYENNQLSRYSMNGNTTDIEVCLSGEWDGELPYEEFVRQVKLELTPDENNPMFVNGIVTFTDRRMEETVLPKEDSEEVSESQEATEKSSDFVERSGKYTVKGLCDPANYMRIQFVFVQWLEKADTDTLIEWNGYYDCGTNEIILDAFQERPLERRRTISDVTPEETDTPAEV